MNEIQFTSISIDNSIFKSYRYNFEEGMLKHLNQFRNHTVEFILPNVIWGEINNHLIADTIEAVKKINDLNENIIAKNYIPKLKAKDFQIFEYSSNSPKEIACKRLETFKQVTGLKLLEESKYLQLDELIKGYFENKAPFESREKKKYEFPDAIALYALDNYAKNNKKYILLVSVDEGWVNYCKKSKYLHCEKKIPDALDLINQQKGLDFEPIKAYVNEHITQIKNDSESNYIDFEHIEEFIQQYPYEFSFYPSNFEVEGWSETIGVDNFSIEDIDLVEINSIENTYTINVELSFTLYVSVDFDFYNNTYSSDESYLQNQVDDLQYDEKINILQTIKIDESLCIDKYELIDVEYEYSSGTLEVEISEYY